MYISSLGSRLSGLDGGNLLGEFLGDDLLFLFLFFWGFLYYGLLGLDSSLNGGFLDWYWLIFRFIRVFFFHLGDLSNHLNGGLGNWLSSNYGGNLLSNSDSSGGDLLWLIGIRLFNDSLLGNRLSSNDGLSNGLSSNYGLLDNNGGFFGWFIFRLFNDSLLGDGLSSNNGLSNGLSSNNCLLGY